ncbi:MAG: hypothetical protein SVO26_05985 [Chloroflexota bacterium]|nr:hypothetical protein [Chloroflexota bacterium]
MLKYLSWIYQKARLLKDRTGTTLVEVAISVSVLGIMASTVPGVMVLIMDRQFQHNEEQIAENLTRSQFEFIKSQDYVWGNDTELYDYETGHWKRVTYNLVEPPSNYRIRVLADPINPETGEALNSGEDMGTQLITVTVFGYRYFTEESSNWLLRTTGYKLAQSPEITSYEVAH